MLPRHLMPVPSEARPRLLLVLLTHVAEQTRRKTQTARDRRCGQGMHQSPDKLQGVLHKDQFKNVFCHPVSLHRNPKAKLVTSGDSGPQAGPQRAERHGK